jgi:hypothetical protein
MFTVLLPPGVNPTAVNKYKISYQKKAEDSNPKPFENEAKVRELLLANARPVSTGTKQVHAF